VEGYWQKTIEVLGEKTLSVQNKLYIRLSGFETEPLFKAEFIIIYLFIIYFTANGFVPDGSGTTITHNTQNNTITQNNTQHTK
jgi:hypothetical protein